MVRQSTLYLVFDQESPQPWTGILKYSQVWSNGAGLTYVRTRVYGQSGRATMVERTLPAVVLV